MQQDYRSRGSSAGLAFKAEGLPQCVLLLLGAARGTQGERKGELLSQSLGFSVANVAVGLSRRERGRGVEQKGSRGNAPCWALISGTKTGVHDRLP